ncbi:MerR family transcriptional regulator [Clostridium guangxiense]|uniref:MerR family transcriptional regulator n=1 Tax=Clostridium guangxiense TaxID=1662055 RepID=UPI001E3884A6|nr:GyrI-like domain-containing protein [Clostridium guangxiense]
MYKIGEFSKITGLTVKTLRYYDEENIIEPSYRNEENGYRYYDEEDFKKAQLIIVLRELEFSIAEIKDVISNFESPDDLSYFLEEKKKIVQEKMRKEKELIKKINLYINPERKEANCMNYKVEIKNIEEVLVASVRFKGKYSDVSKYIGRLYGVVKGNASGSPFNCYYDDEYKEEADIELCVPISKMIKSNEVEVKKLPKIRAVCVTHKGTYENLNMAYKAVFDYAKEHGLKCSTPSREIYEKGHGKIFKGNPDNYITHIIVPIV